MTDAKGFASRAIHHAYDPAANGGALTPPLHLSSTFAFETAEAGGEAFAGTRDAHIYSRISNPTCALLERRVAALEGAAAGLALASGMGAITATLWTLLAPGDEVIVDQTLYGCTFSFMHHGLAKWGVTVTHVDMTDPAALAGAVGERTRAVYFESPANPNMRLVDIAETAAIAHRVGATVLVDNTYATPYLTRPIELGADVVLHSATKYLGGHGDLVGGVAAGSAELMADVRLIGMKDLTGAVMAPFNAMLVLRGLKTLALRMEQHCASAERVAEWLAAHPQVRAVYYPGLAAGAQRELVARQMARPGGMIAFELYGDAADGIAVMNQLTMIQRAVSLGDAETLIEHPASMTHSTYTPAEQAEHGISDTLIRLSVGLEDSDDIIADLEHALARPARAAAG